MADEPVATQVETPAVGSAPETPAVSTPAAQPDASPIAMNDGEDELSYLSRVREARSKAEPAKPAEKPVEPAKPEVKPEEKPVAETKPEDKPAEAKTEEAQPGDEEEEDLLDSTGPLPIKELAEKLKNNPEVEAALEKAGIPRNSLFATSRLAAFATQIKPLVPDVETAQYLQQTATTFHDLDEAFTGIKPNDMQSVDTFVGKLFEADRALNADGTPAVDEQGKPMYQGYVQTFFQNVGQQMKFDMVHELEEEGKALTNSKDEAKQQKGEELLAVAHILKGRMGGSPSAEEDVPEAVKAERAAAKAELAQAHQLRAEDAQAKWQGFEDGILNDSLKQFDGLIDNLLTRTDLDDDDKQTARDRIRDGLTDKLASDKLYLGYREQLRRRGASPEIAKLRTAHNVNTAKAKFKEVAEPIIKKLGGKVIARQQERKAKIDTQVKRTEHTEIKGGAGPAKPAAQPEGRVLHQMIRENYRKQNGGNDPDEETMFTLIRQAKAQQA